MLMLPFALYPLFARGGGGGLDCGHAALLQIHMAAGGALALNGGDIVNVVMVIALSLDFGAPPAPMLHRSCA